MVVVAALLFTKLPLPSISQPARLYGVVVPTGVADAIMASFAVPVCTEYDAMAGTCAVCTSSPYVRVEPLLFSGVKELIKVPAIPLRIFLSKTLFKAPSSVV